MTFTPSEYTVLQEKVNERGPIFTPAGIHVAPS
jgi:hypothetical protein